MNKYLYLECTSGISGDMFVASLLDLGANEAVLKKALDSLCVQGFRIEITRVKKSGLDACDFNVILDEEHENYDHDMQYLYGKAEDMQRKKHHHMQMHEHRGLKEIILIIESADMTQNAKDIAIRIFEILAKAEAKVHGSTIEEVHFHEVGAIDSIVDVIAAAVCFDNLNIEDVIVTQLYEGMGEVRCQHGVLPIPVPAVTEIVREYQIPLHIMDTKGEFVTPTGAAIAAAICTQKELPKRFVIKKTGLGAGKRKHEKSGILRTMMIEEESFL